jgi:hypothetical protein
MTFDDVIEKHRVATGASRLRVTPGPEATPGTLDAELTRIGAIGAAHAAFRPEEIEAAKVARLRGLLREIDGLARAGDVSAILLKTDLIADVDLEADIAWMRAEREKRGEPLPAA